MKIRHTFLYAVLSGACAGMATISPHVHAQVQSDAQTALQADAPLPAAEIGTRSRFVRDSKLTLVFRNYAENLDIDRTTDRVGWVQAMQARFESGMTDGPVRFGIDAAPFVALKLNGGEGSRNLVHMEPDGSGQREKIWAYLGTYAVKAEFVDTLFRIGKEVIHNPFLEPYDIRALPPSFRGAWFTNHSFSGLTLDGGTVDAVNARGATGLKPLATAYGGTVYDRMNYVGGEWKWSDKTAFSVYVNQAKDVWKQTYFSASQSFGSGGDVLWQLRGDLYRTRAEGRKRQGEIDNKAASVALSASRGPSTLILGHQRIFGDQFFDFAEETAGIYLSNSMGLDYNAPHEKSVQVRYKFDGAGMGIPGLTLSAWKIKGWGVDATKEANRNAAADASLHALYWLEGKPIAGGHSEQAIQARYTVQRGTFKGMSFMYIHIGHKMDPTYPSKNFDIDRVMIDYAVRVF